MFFSSPSSPSKLDDLALISMKRQNLAKDTATVEPYLQTWHRWLHQSDKQHISCVWRALVSLGKTLFQQYNNKNGVDEFGLVDAFPSWTVMRSWGQNRTLRCQHVPWRRCREPWSRERSSRSKWSSSGSPLVWPHSESVAPLSGRCLAPLLGPHRS